MDWFKYLKRSGSPIKHRWSTKDGWSIGWIYKFNFSFLRPNGYTPEFQLQVFENGFDSPAHGIGAKPLEVRLTMLLVPREVGYNAATGIFIPLPQFDSLDKTTMWQMVPKEKISRFLDQNRGKIYSCFMKAIFEHLLEK